MLKSNIKKKKLNLREILFPGSYCFWVWRSVWECWYSLVWPTRWRRMSRGRCSTLCPRPCTGPSSPWPAQVTIITHNKRPLHTEHHRLWRCCSADRGREVCWISVRDLRSALHHPPNPHHCGKLQQVLRCAPNQLLVLLHQGVFS